MGEVSLPSEFQAPIGPCCHSHHCRIAWRLGHETMEKRLKQKRTIISSTHPEHQGVSFPDPQVRTRETLWELCLFPKFQILAALEPGQGIPEDTKMVNSLVQWPSSPICLLIFSLQSPLVVALCILFRLYYGIQWEQCVLSSGIKIALKLNKFKYFPISTKQNYWFL